MEFPIIRLGFPIISTSTPSFQTFKNHFKVFQLKMTMWRTGTLQPSLQNKNLEEQNLNFEAEIKTHSEEWARCLKSNELPPSWVGPPHCHQNSRVSRFNQIFDRDDEDTQDTERGGTNYSLEIYCSGIF